MKREVNEENRILRLRGCGKRIHGKGAMEYPTMVSQNLARN